MKITIKRVTDWRSVLDAARVTSGKEAQGKEPSDKFKRDMIRSEHSPLRALLFDVLFEGIPYYVAMHLRTHSIGFMSGEDDLYFVKTQRTDRTQRERDKLTQDEPVNMHVVINAHSIINISRVRLCRKADPATRRIWTAFIDYLGANECRLASVCVPNCTYRGFCPEPESCGYNFDKDRDAYLSIVKVHH